MSSKRESSINSEENSETCGQRLFKKDDRYFRKYIDNTTAHGVVRIFTSKSIIRRLFWLVIVLGATAGCLNNVIDRIIYLAGQPTSTTVSITRQPNLTFPAVTVCNLNQFRRDYVNFIHPNLSRLLRGVYYTEPDDPTDRELCKSKVVNFTTMADLTSLSLQNLSIIGSDSVSEFILFCVFSGRVCNTSHFTPVFTKLGLCYTFNAGENETVHFAESTGTRSGLSLLINIHQSEYVSSDNFDAGVKVAVHPQTEPPLPDDIGIGVPPGRNAFIGLRQKDILDNTRRNCQGKSETSNFNFLRNEYNYSTSSCLVDCLLTSVSDNCGCNVASDIFPPDNEVYQQRPDCNIADICCQVDEYRTSQDCDCPSACISNTYDIFTSYSAFPAQYAIDDLEEIFSDVFNTSFDTESNLLSVNVYFETLNIETQTTSDAYGAVALLSDIGGQLGLFMGVSVISIMEFATWIIDEVKNRVFGKRLSETKICSCCKRLKVEEREAELDGVADDKFTQSQI